MDKKNTPKKKRLLILVIALVLVALIGVTSYFLKRYISRNKNPLSGRECSPAVGEEIAEVKKYEIEKYGVVFDYPQNYVIGADVSENDRCNRVTSGEVGENCLVEVSLKPEDNDFIPSINFYLLEGVDSVNIIGMLSSIKFNPEKKVWEKHETIGDTGSVTQQLSVWGYTQDRNSIFKSESGGSQGGDYFYIIPLDEENRVAIFSVPKFKRIRCDLIEDKTKQKKCYDFYIEVIDKYNNGKLPSCNTWLPDKYIKWMYLDGEDIVRSFRKIST